MYEGSLVRFRSVVALPIGSKYLRLEVPAPFKTITGLVCGTSNLKYCVLGPSEIFVPGSFLKFRPGEASDLRTLVPEKNILSVVWPFGTSILTS